MKITIQAKLTFLSKEDEQAVVDLMRRWSACMRFAYNRLLEGKSRNELKGELQGVFNLNSRYVDDAAKGVLESCKERGENPRKVIFGGRSLFEKLKKRHINGKAYKKLKQKWQEKRKGNLYSRGDKSKKGNLNTRDGNVYAYFTTEGEYLEIEITKTYGVIGIDLNAYPNHIAWAETDECGNLINYGEMPMPELSSDNGNKRDYYTWIYAHKIIGLAKEKGKAIVIEKLRIKNRGKRGDYSGKLSRRIRHNFAYRKLLERIKLLAKRNGIEVIEVDPQYTSIVGMLKYAPQYRVSKDVASAYVIARRGLGLKEKVPKNYMELLRKLSIEELRELKEYVKENVKNAYLKAKHIKEIEALIKALSLGSEPERVFQPLEGTSLGTQFNPWRVLKVVVITTLSPDKVLRDMSVLKSRLILGQVGRPETRARVPASWGRGYGFPKYRLLGNGKPELGGIKVLQPKLVQFCTV